MGREKERKRRQGRKGKGKKEEGRTVRPKKHCFLASAPESKSHAKNSRIKFTKKVLGEVVMEPHRK